MRTPLLPKFGLKEALIAAAIGAHFPRYWMRLQDVAANGGLAASLVYLALFSGLVAAIVAAAQSPRAAVRWFWALVFAVAMAFVESEQAILGQNLEYGTFVGQLAEVGTLGDALSQFPRPIALSVLNALILLAGIVWKPRSSQLGESRLSAAAPAAAVLLLSALSFLRGGGGVEGLPSPFIPLAYGSLYAYENLARGRDPRKPVEIPLVSKPRYRAVIMLVDESVRGDYLDLNSPRGVRSGLEGGGSPATVNFGLAASITNCSAGTNLSLRFGGTRDNYRTTRDAMPSIWKYAKKAGYRTVYIDGQHAGGVVSNGMTAYETKDIDRLIQFGGVPVPLRDMEIARVLGEMIGGSEPVFIYANKVGAHFPVSDKFPEAFAKYSPMLPREGAAAAEVAEINTAHRAASDWSLYKNSYKNTLLWSVGEFFDRLRKYVVFNRVLVLYTSDHGQNFHERGEPGLNTHCSPVPSVEEGLVPLAVLTDSADARRWREAARANFNAASHYNLFPTILDAMGYDAAAVKTEYGPPLTEKLADPFTFNARYEARFRAKPVWVKIDLKQVIGP